MRTLLEEMVEFVDANPSATLAHLRAEFGKPVFEKAGFGGYKVYSDLVWQRGGQFVQVQHREFAHDQVIRVREVEPMEIIKVEVRYVGAKPGSEDNPDGWVNRSRFAPTGDAIMAALAGD